MVSLTVSHCALDKEKREGVSSFAPFQQMDSFNRLRPSPSGRFHIRLEQGHNTVPLAGKGCFLPRRQATDFMI